jgi:hypothetical protein
MTDPKGEVSLLRLYLLRAVYLLILVGLALTIWPLLIDQRPGWPLMNSVVAAMLAAVSLLAALGLRYPLRMLPLLLFELLWKAIWLLGVALPAWQAGRLDAAMRSTVFDCVLVVVVLVAVPWPYVWRHYLKAAGDRWR